MAFDLITIGDSVVDTIIPLKKAEVVIKKGSTLLGLPFGSKVPVEEASSTVGGNAANNAVGASRLGLKTAIYTHVGNKDEDQNDDRIKAKLKSEKVDLRYVSETDEFPSNNNIILNYEGERTILIHHQPWKYQLPDLDKARWVYFTSLSESYLNTSIVDQVINYLERTRARLVFQPGTFQIAQGKKNAKLIAISELVVVNKEEAKLLLGIKDEEKVNIKKLLKGLADLGARNVVITAGKIGSYGFDGEKYYQLEVFPAEVVEVSGAGDAYATGVLAGLFYKKDLAEAMRWGSANSASVVEYIGTQEGLLSYEQIQERLAANKKIIAKEI